MVQITWLKFGEFVKLNKRVDCIDLALAIGPGYDLTAQVPTQT